MKHKFLLLSLLISSITFAQPFENSKRTNSIALSEAKSHHTAILNTSNVTNEYDMKHIRCEWNIDPAVYYISGGVTSTFVTGSNPLSQIDFDFSIPMIVDSVIYHGTAVTFVHTTDLLVITFPATVSPGTLDSVTVYYQGSPVSTGFGSFTQTNHSGVPIISTLSEPYGARDWWPCKQSLDDKIDSIDIIVTVPVGNRVGSNGVLISETQVGNNKIFHWQSHYKITAYLVAIAVSNYAAYSDYLPLSASDTLEILNFVYPEDSATAVSESPYILDVISLYDSLFITYPFANEKYGHCQWNWGGGEEHQTMSFVSDFSQGLIAHECAHQWFGDYITCATFEDVWLNEGFATYSEALCEQYLLAPHFWTDWKNFTRDNITGVPDGSVFCDDTTSVGRIFDGRLTYDKGAFVLHMLRWVLGDSLFFQSVKNYLNDTSLAYGYARTADLKNHLESTSGMNLTQFFDQWYYGQGYPTYFINWNHQGNDVRVNISQSQSHFSVPFFAMPLPVMFDDGVNDTTIVFDNTFSGEEFVAHLNFSPLYVTFDPEAWILSAFNNINYDSTLSVESNQSKISIHVFPNPTSGKLNIISNDLKGDAKIFIRNILTQSVKESEYYFDTNHTSLDLSDLSNGIYQLTIINGDVSFNSKVVITNR